MLYQIGYSGWQTVEVEADSKEQAEQKFWDDGLNELNDAEIDDIVEVKRDRHNDLVCPKYGGVVLHDEDGHCSLCGADLIDAVVIEVNGGVAQATHIPGNIKVEIVDHDNLEAVK